MLVCINKKSPEYQTLLKRSGIPDSTLEVICRSFMTKYNRLPHLDEITNSNSEPSLRSELKLGVYNETSISNVLNSTGKQTVEEANIELNNQYRDLEVEVVPLNNDAIIDITHRPTDNNFDNWSEEDEILSRASRDGSGNLLAPNGKISNLTEKQYAQVRTKAFKRWFGDWERVAKSKLGNNIGDIDISEIINEDNSINFDKLEEITDKYFKTADSSLFKQNRETLRERKEHHDGETNTLEHLQNVVKTASELNIREDLKPTLVLAAALHDISKPFHGGQIHGYQSVDIINKLFKGNINNLVKFAIRHHMLTLDESKSFTQEDANRIIQDAKDNNLNINDAINVLLALNTADIIRGRNLSVIDKYTNKSLINTINSEIPRKRLLLENATTNDVSKVVDENGEPLVVYHRSDIENLSIFDISKAKKEDKFLAFAYHFGTEKAADEVDLYGSNISSKYAVFLNIKNEFKWTDYDQGDFVRALKSLYNNDVISYEEMNKFRDYKYNKSAEERLNLMKSLFERMNKDGYSYINNVEDIGSKSWAVFNSNQIKSATSNSGSFNRFSNNIYDPEPNGYLVLNNALQKLAKLYGINFNTVTNAELNSDKWRNIISDPSSVNAFIYNGQIYINLDKASLDAPLHEMMHIFVGSIRFSDPKLYSSLISLAEKFPNYTETAKQFSGRTRNDINEEIFILEISRYLMGYKSVLHNLDNKTKYEISYNIKRLLDTILMGQNSVKTISNDRLFQLSLMQIAQEVNSAVMTNNFHGTINVENSELHRKLNNIKSDLYKQGILYCD